MVMNDFSGKILLRGPRWQKKDSQETFAKAEGIVALNERFTSQ